MKLETEIEMETERKLKLKKIVVEQIGEETHKVEFHIYDMALALMVLDIPSDDDLLIVDKINKDSQVNDILLSAKIKAVDPRGSKVSVIPEQDNEDN